MRLVFGLVLLLGLGLAGFAVYMAQDYINATEAQLARERQARQAVVPTTEVFVSTREIRYGDRLQRDYVRPVLWPVDGVPEGAFTKIEDLFPEGENEPRTVLRAMEPGEAILAVKVTKPGEDAGVSSSLSPGMRAFALRVDVASGVSGFLRPGDRVDVYWTGRAENTGGGRDFTRLIEAGIKLIAVDQSADQDRNNPTVARTVTVEATPVQVASLAQAQATGRLQLSLVGAQDDDVAAGSVQIDQRVLLGIEEEVVRIERQEKVCTVRTRKGAEVVEIPIPCTN